MLANHPTRAAATPHGSRTKPAANTVAMPAALPSKSDTVIKLLLRAKGATLPELIAATDWQAHSVRAFLSGLRKKARTITREARKNGEFAYRIVEVAEPPWEAVNGTAVTTYSGTTGTADNGTTADNAGT